MSGAADASMHTIADQRQRAELELVQRQVELEPGEARRPRSRQQGPELEPGPGADRRELLRSARQLELALQPARVEPRQHGELCLEAAAIAARGLPWVAQLHFQLRLRLCQWLV